MSGDLKPDDRIKPDTPFPRHWVYYIAIKIAVIVIAVAVALKLFEVW